VSRARTQRRRRQRASRDLIGRDLARVRITPRSRRRLMAALLASALVAGLSLAALRIDILRLRYALAEALEHEKQLLEERRVVTAHLEGLRDPARLASLAEARGLTAPTRVIELAPAAAAPGARP
jgi:hypothetical protein